MAKRSPKKWADLKQRMSPQAQSRIDTRVRATLASMPLAEIRKAVGQTQAELADSIGIAQGSVSKIENAADMYLSTLRKYIEALGGELHLTVTFPDGRSMQIDNVSDLAAG